MRLTVDGVTLSFPEDWDASKYDDWAYYRSNLASYLKAVDVLAVSPDGKVFLIEVKDYRRPGTQQPSGLPEELQRKFIDTLAAMIPTRLMGSGAEQALAKRTCRASYLRLVAHIDVDTSDPQWKLLQANLRQKLKQLLRGIDGAPILTYTGSRITEWTSS